MYESAPCSPPSPSGSRFQHEEAVADTVPVLSEYRCANSSQSAPGHWPLHPMHSMCRSLGIASFVRLTTSYLEQPYGTTSMYPSDSNTLTLRGAGAPAPAIARIIISALYFLTPALPLFLIDTWLSHDVTSDSEIIPLDSIASVTNSM